MSRIPDCSEDALQCLVVGREWISHGADDLIL